MTKLISKLFKDLPTKGEESKFFLHGQAYRKISECEAALVDSITIIPYPYQTISIEAPKLTFGALPPNKFFKIKDNNGNLGKHIYLKLAIPIKIENNMGYNPYFSQNAIVVMAPTSKQLGISVSFAGLFKMFQDNVEVEEVELVEKV